MIKKLILLFSLVIFLGTAAAGHVALALSLEGAIKNYQNGKFNKAEREWQDLAEAGDADALFNLGQMYHLGKGAAFDDRKAADYFLAAANMGHTAAARELGNLYFFSPGVNGGKEAAIGWWQKAAIAGDGPAQYILGIINFNGDGVAQNTVLGFAWTLLAIDVGVREAIQSQTAMRGQLTDQQLSESQAMAKTLMTGNPNQAAASLLVGEAPGKPRTLQTPSETAQMDLPAAEEPAVKIEETPALVVEETKEELPVEVEPEPEPKPEPVTVAPVEDLVVEEKIPEEEVLEEQIPEQPADNFTETREALNGLIEETSPVIEELGPEDTYDLGDPLSPLVTEDNFSPDWSLQLASFRKPENAEAQWQTLSGKNPDLFAGLEKRIVRFDLGQDRGIYYRLRIGPFADKDAADQKCLDLKDAGLDCLVIWP